MRRPLASWLICCAAVFATRASAAVNPDQIEALFRPFLAEQVTLAPDGRHVAYTEHAGQELNVMIMALDPPFAQQRILVADDQVLSFSNEKQRARLRFLGWATSNRLVFAPAEEVVTGKHYAPIMAVDADGKNPRTLMDGPDFLTTPAPDTLAPPGVDQRVSFGVPRFSRIVGFIDHDRTSLLVQATGSPTTTFKLNVLTGKFSTLSEEFFPGSFALDRQGRFRLAYLREPHAPEGTFELLGGGKFNAALLGPLAAHFTISTHNYFGERAYPLGFDVDPNVLYVASNVGRDTFGIYAYDLKAKRRTAVALEAPHVDLAPLEPSYPSAQLVFDEYQGRFAGVRSPGPKPVTVWQDPGIAAVQRAAERNFPQRTVQILEWSEARTAFLLLVTGGTEPGRTFVWQKPANLLLEILRRAPWLPAAQLHPTEFFAFDTAHGVHLTGYLTLPSKPRLNPPPAIICFADGFPAAPHAEFSREAQVLASMGFVVIRLNHRGVGGFGIKHREAILAGIDRVPVDDALSTIDWIAARHPIDRKRIATMGNGFGGYLAVRALQLHPEAFRCAVAFNAPLNPERWLRPPVDVGAFGAPMPPINFPQEVNREFLARGSADLRTLSVSDKPETLTNPVCLILDPIRDAMITDANQRLRNQVRRQGGVADYLEVNPDYAAELPQARARVYDHLEEFFNLNLYDYNVKIGPTKEIK